MEERAFSKAGLCHTDPGLFLPKSTPTPVYRETRTMGGGGNASSQETGVTVAEASIGAVKEFPEGKPYRVDKGLNAARKRARDPMAPLNNKTQQSTYPCGIYGIPTEY